MKWSHGEFYRDKDCSIGTTHLSVDWIANSRLVTISGNDVISSITESQELSSVDWRYQFENVMRPSIDGLMLH